MGQHVIVCILFTFCNNIRKSLSFFPRKNMGGKRSKWLSNVNIPEGTEMHSKSLDAGACAALRMNIFSFLTHWTLSSVEGKKSSFITPLSGRALSLCAVE